MTKKLTKETIGVGIVGTGFIGPAHVEALSRNGIRVLGLCENTLENARAKAIELTIPKAYGSYAELLKDNAIDVVHLATPNYLHFEQAKAALLAGKHVVCEKPLAMNSTETKELVELAKEKKLVNAVNFNIRMYPMVQQARSMVRAGDIGDLFIVQGSYLQDWLLLPTDWNWRLEPDLGGTLRAVADIGSHWLDLISYITGLKILEVFADFKTFHPTRKKPTKPVETYAGKLLTPEDYEDRPIFTEDYASILLHLENGTQGVLTVAQVCSGRKNRIYFEINGSKSSLVWDGERPNELWIGNRHAPNSLMLKDPSLMTSEAQATVSFPGGHNEGFPDTFKQLHKKIYNYIIEGDFSKKPDFPTFEDGHYEILVCEAIERSAHEKTWISL
jgi:predicted dehydrogenase